jgi:uncharacterized protein YjdB
MQIKKRVSRPFGEKPQEVFQNQPGFGRTSPDNFFYPVNSSILKIYPGGAFICCPGFFYIRGCFKTSRFETGSSTKKEYGMRKKTRLSLYAGMAVVCVLALFGACGDLAGGDGSTSVPVTGVVISPSDPSMEVGEALQLMAVVIPDNAADKTLVWTSSASGVAKVSNTGLVTASKAGTAVITAASADGPRGSATVTVVSPVQGITLTGLGGPITSATVINIAVGTSPVTITAEVSPAGVSQTVTWTSDNPAVATVANGVITPVKAGTAHITVTSAIDPAKTITFTVNVAAGPVPITGISLDKTTFSLGKTESETLFVTYNPTNTTQQGVTWASDNTSVATVANGTVTAVAVGTATITAASTANSGITVSCTVTVTVPLVGITLTPNPLDITGVWSTGSFTVNYDPPDTTEQGVTWSSSNTSVATVSGGTVTAVAGGTATITATSTANPSITATATVNVIIPVTKIDLDKTTLNLNKGGTETLTVSFTPTNTTQTGVTWSSSNPSVATVSGGVVTAVGAGNATITAVSSVNSGIKADCTVTVIVPLAEIILTPNSLDIGVGATSSFTVNYNPSDTTEQGVTWSSSNPSVATVANGTVTAVGTGTATITATSSVNNSITGTATVNVIIPVTGLSLNKTTLSLTKGGTDTLTVSFTPTTTTQTGVIWSSSDTSVATVSGGVVTAVGGGTATITATSSADSSITATCDVTVTVPLTGISLPPTLTLGEGGASFLTVTYTPSDTTQRGVTWSSSDTTVATVNNSTGLITAVAVGTATITAASTANSSITATCTVTVQATFNGAGVNIEFEGLEDQTITLDVTLNQGDVFVVTAPSGFDRYLWYLNSSYMGSTSTPTVTYPVGNIRPGRHYITVIVEEDGYHFSKTVAYTVGS